MVVSVATTPTGGGNPNFFTTYKGRYALELSTGATSSNKTLMLSIVNDVQFTGSVELTGYVAGSAFATLPAACRPETPAKFPVVVGEAVELMSIGADGTMTLPADHATATVHLSGVSFNITGNFYREVTQP